ncbi:futalosine hydrolase [Sphingobacterium sp. SGG-5]|uniref:futalosine hydrolase n=1 Tax=Sphingobacterium sp. SGG-5 TaxID=2710881 RepID=UPI0013E9AB4A|nr:futalosine hydrolase [Sphingobacterium sp. SGG-5]NGM60983.1 futalosine hydrolase [Sphingobacterium sp. SGG-5]
MHPKPLIVAATQAEIMPSIPFFEEHRIPYIVTGVGMLATTYALTKALARSPSSLVLNVGIAGSFSHNIAIGSVVEIIHDTLSELGAESSEGFIPIEELGFGSSSWSSLPIDSVQTDLPRVQAITVNKVHGSLTSIAHLQKRLPEIHVESMEGAAAFYVCHEENMPCIQVRSISNYVEARDKSAWDIPLAIRNLNHWLNNFLTSNSALFLR